MHLHFLYPLAQLTLLAFNTMASSTFRPLYDEHCTSLVRHNFRSFHINLSKGDYAANGPLVSSDMYWNYDGTIILSRQGFTTALSGFVESALKGLSAVDRYNIVDGNRGAVLLRLSGKQSGPFVGLPLQEYGRYDVWEAEKVVFDEDALARSFITMTPIDLMKEQMKGVIPVSGAPSNTTYGNNPQTSRQFRERLRTMMAAFHLNANAGNANANAAFATENVQIEENGVFSHGRDAFVASVTSQNAGKGAFPEKLFHDVDILADGKLGAVEYVWQAPQKSEYAGIAVKENAAVRLRGMLFLEFSDEGLVEKVIHVFDEGVVNKTLTGTGGWLYT
jgi:predicted ester cyclase